MQEDCPVSDWYSPGWQLVCSIEEISLEFKSLNLPLSIKDIRVISILKLNKMVFLI